MLRDRQLNEEAVLTMHKMFYKDIDGEAAGRYRTGSVIITGSKYAVCKAARIQAEMQRLFIWIKEERGRYHPLEFAAQLHKRFVFIHPFVDGNGRIARLLMNTSLIQDGYMLAVITPVSRLEYISLLEKAHIDDKPFIEFISLRVLESEKEIMRLLHIPIPKII